MKKISEEFVTIDIAKHLKQLGYNGVCLAAHIEFDNQEPELEIGGIFKHTLLSEEMYKAPLWQQVIDWFETEKHMIIDENLYYSFTIQKWCIANNIRPDFNEDILSKTFESKYEAIKECVIIALNKIK